MRQTFFFYLIRKRVNRMEIGGCFRSLGGVSHRRRDSPTATSRPTASICPCHRQCRCGRFFRVSLIGRQLGIFRTGTSASSRRAVRSLPTLRVIRRSIRCLKTIDRLAAEHRRISDPPAADRDSARRADTSPHNHDHLSPFPVAQRPDLFRRVGRRSPPY